MLEGAKNDGAGILFVFRSDFVGLQIFGDRHGAVESVGVSGAEARDGAAGLGPGDGEFGVGVRDTADVREGFVEFEMRGKVGGRRAGCLR